MYVWLNLGLKDASWCFYLTLTLLLPTLWLQGVLSTKIPEDMDAVLLWFCRWDKTLAESHLRRKERAYFILQIIVCHHQGKPGEKLEAGTSRRQELKQDQRGMLLPDFLVLAHLATFVMQARPIYLGKSVPTVGWVLRYQLAIKKVPPRTHPKANLKVRFSPPRWC